MFVSGHGLHPVAGVRAGVERRLPSEAGGLRAEADHGSSDDPDMSEVCELKWRDFQPRGEAGQVTVYGRGAKTRAILPMRGTWEVVAAAGPEEATPDAPVFRSGKRGWHLDPSRVMRIVRAAGARAGIQVNVSPHWLRHAHASHALDRGCPIHLVQATLGHASVATTGGYLNVRPTDSSTRYLAL